MRIPKDEIYLMDALLCFGSRLHSLGPVEDCNTSCSVALRLTIPGVMQGSDNQRQRQRLSHVCSSNVILTVPSPLLKC